MHTHMPTHTHTHAHYLQSRTTNLSIKVSLSGTSSAVSADIDVTLDAAEAPSVTSVISLGTNSSSSRIFEVISGSAWSNLKSSIGYRAKNPNVRAVPLHLQKKAFTMQRYKAHTQAHTHANTNTALTTHWS